MVSTKQGDGEASFTLREGLSLFWSLGPSGLGSAPRLGEEQGDGRPFSLFLLAMGLSLRRGLEGATGSLLGAGVKALGELFFAAGFEAECAGNGVGDDLGSWVALALEASDLRWKKPRMDFWLEAGVCFLPLADGLGVDIVGRQWCTQWTKVGGEDDAGGFGCDVDEVARPGGDAQMAGGARRDRVSLGPSFRSLHSPTPSSCNHNRCHVNFHTKLLVTQHVLQASLDSRIGLVLMTCARDKRLPRQIPRAPTRLPLSRPLRAYSSRLDTRVINRCKHLCSGGCFNSPRYAASIISHSRGTTKIRQSLIAEYD